MDIVENSIDHITTMGRNSTFFCAAILHLWLTALPVHAQGTTGFEVLRIQTHPRGSALGGAVVADAGHIESVYFNPAGLGAIQQRIAAAGYMNYLLDIGAGYLAYAQPDPHWGGVWGLTVNYINYGDFDGSSASGEDIADFSASDVVLGMSYAYNITKRICAGAGGKFVYSDIAGYSSSALAVDIGGQYSIISNRFGLGAGIYNLGSATDAYISHKDKLPLYYRAGIWGIPEGFPAKLYFSLSLYHEYADNYSLGNIEGSDILDFLGDIYYGFGAEFQPMEIVHLRLGYDTRGLDQKVGTRKDALAGISGGMGLNVRGIQMDFALASYGEMGLVQRISLSAGF